MTTKKIVVLGAAAVVLCGVAWWTSAGRRMSSPSLNGRPVLPAFNVADVAKVTIEGEKKLAVSAGDSGWTVDALHGYPADIVKIRENLLKLADLKVGQVARGRKIAKPVKIALKDASGKDLAALVMGETHTAKPRGQAAQFGGGGYPDGRYVEKDGQTVLVKETLDAFDGDPKSWIDRRIASVPSSDISSVVYSRGKESFRLVRKDSSWTLEGLGPKEELDTSKTYSVDSALGYLDLSGVVDPAKESECGFATGAVYTATLKNGITYTAKVGNAVDGSDRALKLAASFKPVGTNAAENASCEKTVKEFNAKNGKWIYTISSYSADNLSKKRADLVKPKEEPKAEKKDDAKASSAAKDGAKKETAKKKP